MSEFDSDEGEERKGKVIEQPTYKGYKYAVLGQVIRYYRLSVGMTQQEAFDAAGCKGSATALSHFEGGYRQGLKYEDIDKLLVLFGLGKEFNSIEDMVQNATAPDGNIKTGTATRRIVRKAGISGLPVAKQLQRLLGPDDPHPKTMIRSFLFKHNTQYHSALSYIDTNKTHYSAEEIEAAKILLQEFFCSPRSKAVNWDNEIANADNRTEKSDDSLVRAANALYAQALVSVQQRRAR